MAFSGRCGVILLLLSATLLADDAGPTLIATVESTPPTLDGSLREAVWSRAQPGILNRAEQLHPSYSSDWSGPADLSAEVRALVAGGDLYLGFRVRDDVRLHRADRAWWTGDSIEVFFDTDLQSQEDDGRYSLDDRQLFLMPFYPRLRWGVVARAPGVPYPDGGLRGVEVAFRETDDGYDVEVRIPLDNFEPFRPDAQGRIGFDVALNDVDRPGDTIPESYMTLSGRFDLALHPANFGRLQLARSPAVAPAVAGGGGGADLVRLSLGVLAVLLLAAGVRALMARASSRSRAGLSRLVWILACAAVVLALLPSLGAWFERGDAERRAERARVALEGAALGFLTVDSGPGADPVGRAQRLHALLRDGHVAIRPRYRYRPLPTSTAGQTGPTSLTAPGRIYYGIELDPGEERWFPLDGFTAPSAVRVDLALRDFEARGGEGAAAEVRLEFADGPPVTALAPREREARVVLTIDEDRVGTAVRGLAVRSLPPHGRVVVDACYALRDGPPLKPWPLLSVSPSGVPLDVWRERPKTHLVPVPSEGVLTLPRVARSGDRLWLALAAAGAFPYSPYEAEVATVRVRYADGPPTLEVRVLNGRDVRDHELVSYALPARSREQVALAWEPPAGVPRHYTLFEVALDPRRTVERIEIHNPGLLRSLRLTAATLGRREAALPGPRTGLVLEGDLLRVRPEVRAKWSRFGLTVGTQGAVVGRSGATAGTPLPVPLPLSEAGDVLLQVRVPVSPWAAALRDLRPWLLAAAALLGAFAVVLIGARFVRRARRMRVKMRAALAAAAVIPFLFLFVGLSTLLNDRAESDLREATLADLRTAVERVAAAPSRARALAARANDLLRLSDSSRDETFHRLVQTVRADLRRSDGAFLLLPDVDAERPSPIGNVDFFDSLTRSGLYFSPWDGLVAVGITRNERRGRVLVGLPGEALLSTRAADDFLLLFGPSGKRIAAAGAVPPQVHEDAPLRIQDGLGADTPVYEPRAPATGEHAAGYEVLRDGARPLGLLGLYRSRAATDSSLAGIRNTLLLAGLAALLLVILAGETLADRVTNPLRRVMSAAGELAAGRLHIRVPVETRDEIGELAASFNSMADALHARVRQLTGLQQGLQSLTAALDRKAVARTAAELLRAALGAHAVSVAALDPAGDGIAPLYEDDEAPALPARLPTEGVLTQAVAQQAPVFDGAEVYVPLTAGGRSVGIAVVHRKAATTPHTGDDPEHLAALARQIGIALENARLYHAALTDEETGLYTHTYFLRRLRGEVDRAAAVGQELSVLRIEVEGYERVAARHGTRAATRLLAEAGKCIARQLPPRHLLARNENSIEVLLIEGGPSAAKAALDRIAGALQDAGLRSLGASIPPPTFSFADATFPADGASAGLLLEALERTPAQARERAPTAPIELRLPPGLRAHFGGSPTMRATLEVVARVAPTGTTVLIAGETGAGKEVIADLIQLNSDRAGRPYLKINCAAVPETLLETELFGHERGAFTGADRQRIGVFEAAHKGTLFLDEIGDLSPAMQVKLLRVLQERTLTRVGGLKPLEVDVRILAATHQDLGDAVRRGRLREDLYYRLNVIEIRVPPLRERREEIPQLIEHFRLECCRAHALDVKGFAPDAVDALHGYSWPGNVRELRNVVERAMLLADGTTVERRHLQLPGHGPQRGPQGPPVQGLTPRQERILRLAHERQGITNGAVVRAEEVSARTALRELQMLVGRGHLVRVGRRRGAVYRPAE